jgi:hypothetical protein
MQVYINVCNRDKMDKILHYSKHIYEIVPRDVAIWGDS